MFTEKDFTFGSQIKIDRYAGPLTPQSKLRDREISARATVC